MDPANVLWFFGAITIAFAVNLLLTTFPDSHNGLWIFLGGARLLPGVRDCLAVSAQLLVVGAGRTRGGTRRFAGSC
jgi:hypothetical protein